MAAATTPIFTVTPNIGISAAITTAVNDYAGSNASDTLLFTAGSNGSFVSYIQAKAAGTNTASNFRLFINNGSTQTSASNDTFFLEYTLPATTAATVTGTANIQIPLNLQLPANYRLYGVITTTVSAGWQFTVVGGNY